MSQSPDKVPHAGSKKKKQREEKRLKKERKSIEQVREQLEGLTVVAFVNPKSGAQRGNAALHFLRLFLTPENVYDLSATDLHSWY